jgi:GNAT superfamily N-acetyltransferase
MSMDRTAFLNRYDAEVRMRPEPLPPGFSYEWDGPVFRLLGPDQEAHSNAVIYARLDATTADAAIAGQIAFFGGKGRSFEWKHFSHDMPHDLDKRLSASGFKKQEPETLVAYDVTKGNPLREAPGDVRVIRLDDPSTFDVIAIVNEAVYGEADQARWLADVIADERRAAPHAISVYAAFAGGTPVSVGWMRYRTGERFGSLYGGSTLPEWRGKGIYSALVGARAQEARERGCTWLTVDCSAMSLPILQRRGFKTLAVTTPYIWSSP